MNAALVNGSKSDAVSWRAGSVPDNVVMGAITAVSSPRVPVMVKLFGQQPLHRLNS